MMYRSVWLPTMVTTALMLVAPALLIGMTWRSLDRLEPMQHHLLLVNRIQRAERDVQLLLIDGSSGAAQSSLDHARAQLVQLLARGDELAMPTRTRLEQTRQQLAADPVSRTALLTALGAIGDALSTESAAHDRLIGAIERDTRLESEIATGIMIAFPMLALLILFLLRHRIFLPLHNLRALMTLLTQQDYRPASLEGVDPMLRPLFENYNLLAQRLASLEHARQMRQRSLENEVRAATQTLLAHQRNLANAERLAVVGEFAAGLAHELRNPLAGIEMALANLRHELANAEHIERLDLVTAELKRLNGLLRGLLTRSRQAPEPARDVELAVVVEELFALAHYQLAPDLRLQHTVPPELRCRLPEGRLRQALLNLVLNAARALGERAGTITVAAQQENGELQVSVYDDGPGFAREQLESGVRPFVTGDRRGTGLGLVMVRRFATDLGGQLQLANREPHGARVTLRLPCVHCGHG
jgi:two-component system NtrC family sensor kinase